MKTHCTSSKGNINSCLGVVHTSDSCKPIRLGIRLSYSLFQSDPAVCITQKIIGTKHKAYAGVIITDRLTESSYDSFTPTEVY